MDILLRRFPASGDDCGFTLLVAIAVAAVGIALAGAVVGLAITTGNASGVDRQHTVAIAAAESGIDSILVRMGDGVPGQEATTFPCGPQPTRTVWSYPDQVSVAVTVVSYTVAATPITSPPAADVPVACPANNQTPKTAKIKVVATLTRAVGTAAAESRTMQATVKLTLPTTTATTPPTLNQAVFGDATIGISNSLVLGESTLGARDADLYSNGEVSCTNVATIEGDITSTTDVNFTNVCTVRGNVWAGNKISTLNKLTIDGDAIAAGATGTTINTGSSGEIKGHVMTNGNIAVENSSTIWGSAVSTAGQVVLGNSGWIKGSAYAGTNIEVGNSAKIDTDAHAVTGTISGVNSSTVGGTAKGRCVGPRPQLTVTGVSTPVQSTTAVTCGATNPAFPATVKPAGTPPRAIPSTVLPPPPQPFPVINSGPSSLAAWTTAGWAIKNFKDPALTGNRCEAAKTYLTGLNSGPATWTGPLLVVIPTCASAGVGDGLTWINNGSITLKHDLAIMSDEGFSTGNLFTVNSSNGSRNLYWIVPSDSPRVTTPYPSCTSPTSGSIRHTNKATVADNVSWLIFTPCKVTFVNAYGESGHPIRGQIYGGTVGVTNAIYLRMHAMAVPGATGGGLTPGTPVVPPTATYSAVASHKSES